MVVGGKVIKIIKKKTMVKKYKVLVEFGHDDKLQPVDTVLELTEEVAAPLVEAGKLEEVVEPTEAE